MAQRSSLAWQRSVTPPLEVVVEIADGEHMHEVRVRAGALRRVVPASLQFCFELLAAGTCTADVALTIDEVPASIACRACGARCTLTLPPFLRAHRGASDVEFLSGEELLVDAIELDRGWRYRPGADRSQEIAANVPAGHLEEHARAERKAHAHGAPAVSFATRNAGLRRRDDEHR